MNLSQVDLAALIERDGIVLRGQSERYGPCPKCGGRDRFHLRHYDDRDYWFCRQCHDKRGDAIEYLRHVHGMTYGESLRALGLRGDRPARISPAKPKPVTARGVVIPNALDEAPAQDWQDAMSTFVDECAARLWTPAGVRALDYLRGRGLSDDPIRAFMLGFNNNRDDYKTGRWRGVTIPTFYGGSLWSVNVRRAAGEPKYKKVTGSRAQLFNGDALAGDPHTVVVVGGEFDCMLAQQHAPDGMVCITFGSESKRPTWEVDYLLRGKRVLIAYDNDGAGEKGAAGWAAFGDRVRVPNGKDITEFAQSDGDVGAWLRSLIGDRSGVFGWDDDYLAAMLDMLGRNGYAPRVTAAGGIVCERETAR